MRVEPKDTQRKPKQSRGDVRPAQSFNNGQIFFVPPRALFLHPFHRFERETVERLDAHGEMFFFGVFEFGVR